MQLGYNELEVDALPTQTLPDDALVVGSHLPKDHYNWTPQHGPQLAMTTCGIEDLFFGGARGGGKTIGMLLDFNIRVMRYGRHMRGVIFLRTFPELEEVLYWARQIYPQLGYQYQAGPRQWKHKSGATLKTRYLDRDKDADRYQGHSYTWLCFDEAGSWPSPEPIDKIRATLRSPYGVPCVIRLTGNPGGVGHNWLKMRYIDPAPPFTPAVHVHRMQDGSVARVERIFIPSTLDDNLMLSQNDPNYWMRVAAAAGDNPALLQAWRYGNWDIVAGGMFDDLWQKDVHIMEPFDLPKTWRFDRSFDWGSSAPFATLWYGESNGEAVQVPGVGQRTYPPGTLFIVAEDYGWNGTPNKGLKLTNAEIARRVKEVERAHERYKFQPGPADTNIYDVISNNSIARDMEKEGVRWKKANKGPGSRVSGWQLIRGMLKASLQQPMEEPGLFVFSTCRNVIRCIPTAPRDARHADDVDTTSEDHIGDALRYRVLQRNIRVTQGRLGGL